METVNLLTHPEEYARRAIEAIQHQLDTAKSPKKIARLTARLKEWEKMLHVLGDTNVEQYG